MSVTTHAPTMDRADVWTRISAPLPTGAVQWRQAGKPSMRDGRWFARFVCYIEANTVRERLDGVVPGEWDLVVTSDGRVSAEGEESDGDYVVKARLSILGVHRECYGQGRDPKAAATDAFKRAAVRFGVGHELYDMEQNWVQVDGDSKFAKPLEDPQTAYNRRYTGKANVVGVAAPATSAAPASAMPQPVLATGGSDDVPCPKCGGKTWDNRVGKKNPKAPDFKCRDKSCDGVIWPPKANASRPREDAYHDHDFDGAPLMTGSDDIPF